MGMSIDEAIKHVEYLEEFSYVKQDRESFITAIDTMRKYQKIEQAYSSYLETMNPETLADLISTII